MNESFIHNNRRGGTGASGRVRRRDPRKLAAIADAARVVMTARGIRLTQVGDVARAAGVAAGTIYLYAADKDALVGLALRSAAGVPLDTGDGPAADPGGLDAVVRRIMDTCLVWPVLAASADAPSDRSTLCAVLAEAYDLVARQRHLIAFLDRCAEELPVLAQAWHEDTRRAYFAALEGCLRRLADHGVVRRDVDLAAATRATLEMIVWMAMRRPRDRVPPNCDDQAARTTTLRLAFAALGVNGGIDGGADPQPS